MWLFAATIFVGAFLLFVVQPLVGKFILPWFGGGSGVWNTCLLFYQSLLLAGYACAHLLVRRAAPKAQAVIHIALLAATLALLPIIPSESLRPESLENPSWQILALLAICIGGPYLMVSTTGPLIQAWFARRYPTRSPYRLYALSNAGSLLGLLSYPFLIEPWLTRIDQGRVWSWMYVVYAAGCAACALVMLRSLRQASPEPLRQSAPSSNDSTSINPTAQRMLWVLLPACASVLLLSFTARLSEEVAPMPLMWVIPLAVYLITFIIAFEWPRLYRRDVFVPLLLISYWIALLVTSKQASLAIHLQIAGYMLVLFVCCMVCHGEVYRLRPPAANLTAFYLGVAFGGALGGVIVAFIAPSIFTFHLEYYLALFATFALLMWCMVNDHASPFYRGDRRLAWLGMIVVVLGAAFGMQRQHVETNQNTVLRSRNFYGVLSVDRVPHRQSKGELFSLYHGRIMHGAQIMHPQWLRWPTTYFGPSTGAGSIFQNFPKQEPRRVGIIGLGVGTLATYGRKGDVFRFYEIDPACIELAWNPFAYLASSPATIEVILGDGRLSLDREEPQAFDVLVLDAFSGDAVPVHLLTREAFHIYLRHVNPDGVILINASNSHINLMPSLTRMAQELGLQPRLAVASSDPSQMTFNATWMLMTRNELLLQTPAISETWHLLREGIADPDVWTDDYANILRAIWK